MDETSTTEIRKKQDRTCELWLFLVVLVSYAYFFQSGQQNEGARFDLLRSIIEDGRLTIDRFIYNSGDIIQYEGHFYSGKAPGLSFLSIPVWWLTSNITPLFIQDVGVADHVNCFVTIVVMIGAVSALLAVYLFRVLRYFTSEANAVGLALIYALGTTAFPFSTLYFAHQIVAAFLFFSFAIIFLDLQENKAVEAPARYFKKYLIAGLLSGAAITTEYPAAIGLCVIGLYLLVKNSFVGGKIEITRSITRAIPFTLGAVIGILPLVTYNFALFGKLFYTPYSVYAANPAGPFPEHAKGFLGITWPSLENLHYISFGLQRGIFPVNPVLTLLIVAIPIAIFESKELKHLRAELVMAVTIMAGFIWLNTSFGAGIMYTGGGASVGPRYLVPMLPFAMLPLAALTYTGLGRFALYFLGLISIAIMLMATATEPRVPYDYLNPVKDLFLWGYTHGRFATEPYGIFSKNLMTDDSVAFNFGKLFGLPGPWQLIPLIALWWLLFLSFWKKLANNKIVNEQHKSLYWIISLFLLVLAVTPLYTANTPKLDGFKFNGLRGNLVPGNRWDICPETLHFYRPADENVVSTQIDKTIMFDWNSNLMPNYTARWRSHLVVEETGPYRFKLEADDKACLYINSKLVVDKWNRPDLRATEGDAFLTQGEQQLDLVYYNDSPGGFLHLFWTRAGAHFVIIPPEALFTN